MCGIGVCDTDNFLVMLSDKTKEQCESVCATGRTKERLPDGLLGEFFYNQHGCGKNDVEGTAPDVSRTESTINYPSTGQPWRGLTQRDNFLAKWTGTIKINQPGRYTFYTLSDDGSELKINGERIVHNPGCHGMRERSGHIDLIAGTHLLTAWASEAGGGAGMEVKWDGPDTNGKQIIPANAFVSDGPPKYGPDFPGLFKNAGQCRAYSWAPSGVCVIYTSCDAVATDVASESVLKQYNEDLSQYLTCKYPPWSPPNSTSM